MSMRNDESHIWYFKLVWLTTLYYVPFISLHYLTTRCTYFVNYTISRYSAGSSLYILKIPQGFNLPRYTYNTFHSVERFASRIDVLSTQVCLSWISCEACVLHIYRAFRISIYHPLSYTKIISGFTEEKSTWSDQKWYDAMRYYLLSEIEIRTVLRFRMFIRDNWRIDPFSRGWIFPSFCREAWEEFLFWLKGEISIFRPKKINIKNLRESPSTRSREKNIIGEKISLRIAS